MNSIADSPIDLAVIGAGPIGVETAAYARQRDWDVHVFERDVVGAHVAEWSHVPFFSDWSLDRSPWGESMLESRGIDLEPEADHPTGGEYLECYLRPLAESPSLDGRIHAHHEVLGIARRNALKTEHVGSPARGESPFVLRVEGGEGVSFVDAEVVIDATGSYATPNGLGPGGLRAIGEEEHREAIEYYIPDVMGADRPVYENRHTLVVGAGYSAVSTLRALQRLRSQAPETAITWCLLDPEDPYALIPDDPLPLRRELSEFGNAAARGEIPEIEVVAGPIRQLQRPSNERWRVDFAETGRAGTLTADNLVANVGYRPDLDLHRELQAHPCWATEGPIDLAASLLSSDAGADCLDQSSSGVEALEHPEPAFFVLGSKSYGRNSTFLLDIGFDQIAEVFGAIDRP